MSKLYQLSEGFRKLMEIVEYELDNNEDLDEGDLQMFVDTLDSIQEEINVKCENIVKFMKNIQSDIDGFKAEEKRLASKRKALENKVESLKTYMEQMLRNADIKEVNAGNFKIKFKKSPPRVNIVYPELIPAQYREKQEDKILKAEIMKDLKANKVVEGAFLVTDNTHMTIS